MKKFLLILILLNLISPISVSANGVIEIENPINATSFEALANNLINFIFYIALALTPLMIIIGAFYLLTAGAEPKRVETGKNIILFTLIGFTIILLAKGLVALIKQILR
jgi:hypothetical protein